MDNAALLIIDAQQKYFAHLASLNDFLAEVKRSDGVITR